MKKLFILLFSILLVLTSFAKGPGDCPANDGKHKRLAYQSAGAREFNRNDRSLAGKVIHTLSFGLIGKKRTGTECFRP